MAARRDGDDVRRHDELRGLAVEERCGGELTIGTAANRTLSYDFDAFSVAGLAIPGLDAVGKLNTGTLAHPLPEWKSQSYVNFNRGPVNLRWSMRYSSGYLDTRWATTAVGYDIDATTLHDFAAVIDLPRDVKLTLAVTNITDEEPPLARLPEGYDAMTTDPLGRTFRLGLRMSF